MSDAEHGTENGWTPPYIAWRTLLNLIERLETNTPPQIDRTFLTGSNQSRTQTLNALKSLELIKEDGTLTDSLMELVEAGSERPAAIRRMLEKFFPKPVELGKVNGTHQQLEDAFEEYGVSGSTLRKAVSFYLKGAAYAKLDLSEHFNKPSATRANRKRTGAKKKGATGKAAAKGTENGPALTTKYIEMLMAKAESQDEMDPDLLDRIESLLVTTENGGAEA